MKFRNKIISAALAAVLSFGAVAMPAGFIETAIVASAETYEDRIESVTKKIKGTDVTLYWDDLESATSYRVYKRTSDGKTYKKYSDYTLKRISDGRIKCTIKGLKKSKTYYFAVAPTKKTIEGDVLVGKKKTVKITTESYTSKSSSTEKLTYIPNPSDICSYLSFVKSSLTDDGKAVIKLYSGMATYDNYKNYQNYLEDHGLYLDFIDGEHEIEDDGDSFTFIFNVYTNSKMTKSLGMVSFTYYIYSDGSGVYVMILTLKT